MFMVEYNLDGPTSSYRMFNPHTQRVIESCNIVWKPWQGKVFDLKDRMDNNVEVSDDKEDTLEQGGPIDNTTEGPAPGQGGNAQQAAAAVAPAQAPTAATQPTTTGTPTQNPKATQVAVAMATTQPSKMTTRTTPMVPTPTIVQLSPAPAPPATRPSTRSQSAVLVTPKELKDSGVNNAAIQKLSNNYMIIPRIGMSIKENFMQSYNSININNAFVQAPITNKGQYNLF